jgi:hypothetical protein
VFFLMGNRESRVQQYPKSGSWVEIEAYRGGFSQTTLEATCSPKFYRLNRLEIQDVQRRLLAPAHDA